MRKNINWLAVMVGVAVFVLYVTTWQKGFQGYEGETANAALKLLDGVYEIKRAGISAALMYLPFVLLIRLFGLNYDFWITLVPVFYSAATAALLVYGVWYLTKKRSVAVAVPMIVALASPMWPYANIGMEYQAMFALTLLFVLLLKWKNGKGSILWPALAFALLATVKSYGPMFGLPLVVFVYLSKKNVKDVVLVVLPAIVAFSIAMTMMYLFSGSVTGGYSLAYEFKVLTWWEGFYGVFFSIGRGIFFFSPLLIVTLFYWKKFFTEHREAAVFLLISFIMILLITASFSYWTDDTWTVRKFLPIVGLMHLPLIYLFSSKWNWKSIRNYFVALLVLASVYVQILGASYYYGTQLDVLRGGDLDTLARMRFTPQLSPITLNNQLFVGYLKGEDQELIYTERSWFRWTAGMEDENLVEAKINLAEFQKPDIVWLNRGKISEEIFLGLVGVDVLLLLFIGGQYFVLRKKKD